MHQIGITINTNNLWSLSIDDLRVYADIFDNPLVFLHFVEQRIQASNSNDIKLDDELDHLGLYLRHNNYSLYAKQLRESPLNHEISFTGYRDPIDIYFFSKLNNDPLPSPKPDIPKRIEYH